jgi:hypothetical protein
VLRAGALAACGKQTETALRRRGERPAAGDAGHRRRRDEQRAPNVIERSGRPKGRKTEVCARDREFRKIPQGRISQDPELLFQIDRVPSRTRRRRR